MPTATRAALPPITACASVGAAAAALDVDVPCAEAVLLAVDPEVPACPADEDDAVAVGEDEGPVEDRLAGSSVPH